MLEINFKLELLHKGVQCFLIDPMTCEDILTWSILAVAAVWHTACAANWLVVLWPGPSVLVHIHWHACC